MDGTELQNSLNNFERHMLDGADAETARHSLRIVLFGFAELPVDGSVGDAIGILAAQPRPPAGSASIVLRAIADNDLLRANSANQLARNVVLLAEKGLPGLSAFIGLQPKSQTYKNFEVLRGVKGWVDGQLKPLLISYTTIGSMVAARKSILSSLSHGRLMEFGTVYHLTEIRDAIDLVLLRMDDVSRITINLAVDVEACERAIEDARELQARYPSFVTVTYLGPWLECASVRLNEFIASLRGRFTALIEQDWTGLDLQKRYPLSEVGRELRILVPFSSNGRSVATDVRIVVSSDSQQILFLNEEIALGGVSPGKFSISLDVHVVEPCESVTAMLEIEWGEVGTSQRQTALFEFRVLAQSAEIDFEAHMYADPYGTAPAEGDGFVGRKDQVQTLIARMLRRPMEPSYITGQKRVGKTSLATAAADQARSRDPKEKFSWCYILWGQIVHEDPRVSLRQLGEQIEEFVIGELPGNASLPKGSYDGSLSALIKLSAAAKAVDAERRFIVIIDEFDEMPQELYLQGNLAETVFGNIRALTTTSNICLLLVGGENMPFVMDRQGQKLNKFSRVNLNYFDRSTEWFDYERLIREPSSGFLEWHPDAIADVYDLTNGNPYFSKIICSKVYARALRERDVDVTKEEVRDAVNSEISRLDENLFAHLWQDGIFVPADEREPIVLKRKRVLAALARCIRSGVSATTANLYANKNSADLTEADIRTVLADFVSRDVLTEKDVGYTAVLPIFQLWLVDIGLTRLASDSLSQDLAAEAQRAEDAARVLSEELVALTSSWPHYRGRHVGPEEVRAWLNQRSSCQDQRALFTILKATRFLSESDILERIRGARLIVLGFAEAAVRRKTSDRRNDIVITYVDGEGKSGQKYASLYAEENLIATSAIIPPSSFQQAYSQHVEKHGTPKLIVVIDDMVGTGRSLSANIKNFHDEHFGLISPDGPPILVFALLSTVEGQKTVLNAFSKLEYPRIDFRAGELLPETASVFHGSGKAFATDEERDRAKAVATDIGATIYKNAPLGYGGQALCIVFPTTVPNNTLPLLHSRGKGATNQWRPLFERLVN